MSDDLFSRRNKPKTDKFVYIIPPKVRSRILANFDHLSQGKGRFENVLYDVCNMCRLAYGELQSHPRYVNTGTTDVQLAIEHFSNCSDDLAIDFIEMIFKSQHCYIRQAGVEAINEIFRQEGIGYEFSPYVINQTRLASQVIFPKATVKTEELLHSQAVMPALFALSNPNFKTANDELLMAHGHFRNGHFEAAITAAGQTFESVFKTILKVKGWAFNDGKDTLATLVDIAKANHYCPVKSQVTARS